MLLKGIEILLAALIFGAIIIVCGVHDEMQMEMRFICVDGGENLILILVVLDGLPSDVGDVFFGDGPSRWKT